MAAILVVENTQQVREMLTLYLRSLGYTVLPASSCEEAMLRAKAYDGVIRMMVTNVFLPGMTGEKLAAYFSAARPDMNVLYISSSTYANLVQDGHPLPEDRFFRKPFSLDALGKKIQELIG